MTTMTVSPQGFWLKSHFYREGNLLHVTTYSCIAGNPEVFHASIDLRPIIAAVVKGHNTLHRNMKVSGEDVRQAVVGFSFSDLNPAKLAKSAVNVVTHPARSVKSVANSAAGIVAKVGKAKLVSQVANGVQSVVKSKVTGAILAGAAIAFPPVGAPAVAAYAAANAALLAIDQAKAVTDTAKKIVDKATPNAVKAKLKSELSKWAGSTVQKAVAAKVEVPKGLGTIAQAVKLAKDRADNAKKLLASTAAKAKRGDVEAQKLARVVTLAKSARDQLTAIKHGRGRTRIRGRAPVSSNLNGFPALLVSSQGHIIPGRYIERRGAPRGIVVRNGRVLRGNFAAVSGDDFGCVVGCSNPFMKPARLR